MTRLSQRLLFWAPRALCILFIGFVSLFALDVFQEGSGFWQTLIALAIHLIPSFVMVAVLVLAWRWEWIGAVLFTGCAVFFALIVRGTWPVKATFAVPCFVTACLFLLNWLKRADLRVRP
jgi:hypothetical protein